MIGNLPFIAVVLMIAIGLYAAMFKRNLIKIVMGITIIQSGVNLFLVSLGYVKGAVAPIYTHTPEKDMVLPVPQALTLTSIVIGVATTALMLSFIMMVNRKYGTCDAREVRRLRE